MAVSSDCCWNHMNKTNVSTSFDMTTDAHPPATISTARLSLRPFQADDLDLFCEFFANEGFIWFSSGNFTRERVAEFVDKVISWDRAGLPSQFVVTIRDT